MAVKILIIDDDHDYAKKTLEKNIRGAVGPNPKIELVTDAGSSKSLSNGLKELHDRQKHLGRRKEPLPSMFDAADVVVVDYDLRKLADTAGLLNGEEVARRLRRYTKCGPIISLNRNGGRIYNLRLQGIPSAGADVSVADEDLRCPGLWNQSWKNGYRPWIWPSLLTMVKNFDKRVTFCEDHWQERVGTALGIPESIRRVMPGDVTRFGEDVLDMTIQHLAAELVPPKEVQSLPVSLKSRAVASFLGTWLEHTVLPSQETIIDAPHIIRLFPSLFDGKRKSKSEFDKLAVVDSTTKLPLKESLISTHASGLDIWTNRKTWWTNQLMMDSGVEEVADPTVYEESRLAFCEDTSRFQPTELTTKVPTRGIFSLRFIEGPDRLGLKPESYQPRALLAQ